MALVFACSSESFIRRTKRMRHSVTRNVKPI